MTDLNAPAIERLLTLKEAAEILGVDVRTLYNYRARGLLTVVKLGHGSVRVAPEDLHACIEQCKIGGTLE